MSFPRVSTITTSQRRTFSGIIWLEDKPSATHVSAHVMFKNGIRIRTQKKETHVGQTLESFLKSLGPKSNPHWSNESVTGFTVRLPGDERRVPANDAYLVGSHYNFFIEGGKVKTCDFAYQK